MEAQILYNPVFGDWPFHSPGSDVAGGFKWEYDLDQIKALAEDHDYHRNLPESSTVDVTDGKATATVSPYSLTRLTVDRAN